MSRELLNKLIEVSGTPARENNVRALVEQELEKNVDEMRIDNLGNLTAIKRGKDDGPKLMLAAHMDQIGFMVSHIDDDGFLRLNPTGGFDPRTMMAQRVTVHGKEALRGVMGSKPIHVLSEDEKKKQMKIEDYFVDLGLPAEKVREKVRVGDMVTWEGRLEDMGEMWCSRAMDDRIGVYMMIEAMKRLGKHEANIYAVATVQEEVGLRGATAAAARIAPDIGLALDVTIANDVPGASGHQKVTSMGKGIAIKRMDSASISSPLLVEHLEEIAEREKINWQPEILPRGGTDAGGIWRVPDGAHVATLSVPSRYVHSTVEMVHRGDVEAGIELLAAYLAEAGSRDYRS